MAGYTSTPPSSKAILWDVYNSAGVQLPPRRPELQQQPWRRFMLATIAVAPRFHIGYTLISPVPPCPTSGHRGGTRFLHGLAGRINWPGDGNGSGYLGPVKRRALVVHRGRRRHRVFSDKRSEVNELR